MANYTGADKRLAYLFQHGGGVGGGHTIENGDGEAMTDRAGLQFINATAVTDDATNDRTIITVLPFKLTGDISSGFLPIYGDEE